MDRFDSVLKSLRLSVMFYLCPSNSSQRHFVLLSFSEKMHFPPKLNKVYITIVVIVVVLAVISVCSDDWLIVRIERMPFGNDTELRVDDIYLGNNCSVTRVLSFNYEFSYPAVSCGISKFVSGT